MRGGRRPAWWRRRDRATAALEFAMVAPVFLMLLIGIVIYSLYFATQIAVVAAATAGARAAVGGLSFAERQILAQETALAVLQSYQPLLNIQKATISAQPLATNTNLFQVTVRYDMQWNGYGTLVPVPTTTPTFTATISNGGY